MKKILTLAVLLITTCTAFAEKIQFNVKGIVDKNTSKVLFYINDMNRNNPQIIPVKNGKFSITGIEERNAILYFMSSETAGVIAMNDGEDLNIDLIKDKIIFGSTANIELDNMLQNINSRAIQFDPVAEIFYKTEIAGTENSKLEREMANYYTQTSNMVVNYCLKHQNDVTPAYIIKEFYSLLNYKQFEQVLNPNSAYFSHPELDEAKGAFAMLAKRRPGINYHELNMIDANGKPAKLSQYLGNHYTLVDFWASWCGPYEQEVLYRKDAYKRYHNLGFDIVGVSLDSKENFWKDVIKSQELNWNQLSDLKGWESEAIVKYGLNIIPANVLIDPTGKIIATDLTGLDLMDKLAEIYQK
ncbi:MULTISPECIES: peroxiredoxin family protein [Segatella]|jgi:peroxiredoxin|uniref:peroxiredoxin family protein n=1 Tax=Segatella TaxID=2974251 RepID=UPI0004128310|nr:MULTISPECIES: TlpA disulfide reductase family protein [Segatella]SDL45468.1 Peroxiredoxin [Segatella bryantii]SEA27890.1 Peroxiredoxin [Segatella bryantii]